MSKYVHTGRYLMEQIDSTQIKEELINNINTRKAVEKRDIIERGKYMRTM